MVQENSYLSHDMARLETMSPAKIHRLFTSPSLYVESNDVSTRDQFFFLHLRHASARLSGGSPTW